MDVTLLGKESDESIARRFGISRRRVYRVRTKLGIPAFRQLARNVLKEIVYEHVSVRQPKGFLQLYYDVLNDWGSVTDRHVRRVLKNLVEERKVARVVAAHQGALDSANGVYLRMDSPLLWETDGYSTILDIAGIGNDPHEMRIGAPWFNHTKF